MSIAIVYYSGTGNTQKMAEGVLEGIQTAGGEATLLDVTETDAASVAKYDKIAFGCPSMGDEVLEEGDFEPFFTDIEGEISGKKVILFGSYDWGDGQWMRDWTERTKSAGADVMDSLIVNLTPEDEEYEKCVDLGKRFNAF